MQAVRHLSLLALLTFVVFFTRLGSAKLWDRDEPRNARCAWEMLERNDWVVPTFNDELRTHKPILLYWLTMTSYLVFGVGEFAARFASATLATATVGLTYLIGRRLFNPHVAIWSGIVLASTLMFNVAAHAATPDSTLIFCSTLAICLYAYSIPRTIWRTSETNDDCSTCDVHSCPWAIAIYGAMGLGVLAKGPVGLVLPTAVIGMFLLLVRLPKADFAAPQPASRYRLWARRALDYLRPFAPIHFLTTCWRMRPMTAILAAAAVAAPWYLAVGLKTNGQWIRGFLLEHNVGRAINSMEGHQGSILFYPVALLVGFFPWSVFAVPVVLWIRHAMRTAEDKKALALLTCWVGVYIVAFTLARTKLPSYITPTYPAVALLCGGFISAFVQKESDRSCASWWPAAAAACLAIVGGLLVVALPIAAHHVIPGDEWLGMVGGIPLLGGMLTLLAIRRQQRPLAMASFSAAAVAFVVSLFAFVAPQVSRHQRIDQLLSAVDRTSQPQFAAYASHEPSWVFYAGQPIPFFRRGHSEQASRFLADRQRFLITTRDRYQELQPQLSTDVQILDEVPYFLQEQDLLLLGKGMSTARRPGAVSR